jgi:hypothetical protein
MNDIAVPAPEIQQELDRLREWTGEDRRVPRLISPVTIVSGILLVASVLAGLLLVQPKPAILLIVALAALVSAAATLISGIHDVLLIHARRLSSPEALAAYFFRCLQRKRFKAAAEAVSGHPGQDWRSGFIKDWKQRFGDAAIAGVQVKETQDVAVDMAYLRIRVELKRRTSAELATTQQVEVRKLAVLRAGRWYFVNGFSNGVHDRRLMRAVKGTGFYEPGDD